jgi:hypothetical protein
MGLLTRNVIPYTSPPHNARIRQAAVALSQSKSCMVICVVLDTSFSAKDIVEAWASVTEWQTNSSYWRMWCLVLTLAVLHVSCGLPC